MPRGSKDRIRVEQIVRSPRQETSQEDVDWVISLMERENIKERAKQDFYRHIQEARTDSLWDEVIQYLAGWLEERVRSF